MVDHSLRQCFSLSRSCTKLGNRDFVSKFVERTEEQSLILLRNGRSKPLLYHLYRLNEQNLSFLKLTPYIVL